MDPELNDEQFTAELGTAAEMAVPPPALVLHAAALRRGTQLRRRRTARNILAGTALTAVAATAVVYGATAGGPRTVTVSAAAAPAPAKPSASASTASSVPASAVAKPTAVPADGGTPQPLAQKAADIAVSLLPAGDTARLAGQSIGLPALTTGTTGVSASFAVATPQGQRSLVVNVSRLDVPASCSGANVGGQTCSTRPLDGGTLVVTSDPGNAQAGKGPVVSYTWNAPGDVLVSAQESGAIGTAATWLTNAQVNALLTASQWQQVTSQLAAPANGSSNSGNYCSTSC